MEKMKYDLDELHAVQLNILKQFIEVCKARNLTYFLGFGSLLGAVRDHRIIPWDDAIDVVMPYYDFDKITNLPQEVWSEDLFMQTYYTDPQYPRYFAKLRNSRTTLIRSEYSSCDINHGIYINIMPIVRLADNRDERKRQIRDAKLYKAIVEGQALPAGDSTLSLYSSILLGSTSGQKKVKLREELKSKVISHEKEDTKDSFVLAGNVSLTLVLPREWFSSAVSWEFEQIPVNIPAGWQEWLTLRYGDYMVTPISELQGNKTAKFVTLNTRRPYTDYKGRTYCV